MSILDSFTYFQILRFFCLLAHIYQAIDRKKSDYFGLTQFDLTLPVLWFVVASDHYESPIKLILFELDSEAPIDKYKVGDIKYLTERHKNICNCNAVCEFVKETRP